MVQQAGRKYNSLSAGSEHRLFWRQRARHIFKPVSKRTETHRRKGHCIGAILSASAPAELIFVDPN